MRIIKKFIKGKTLIEIVFVLILLIIAVRYNDVNQKFQGANTIEKNIDEIMEVNRDVIIKVEDISLCEVEKYNENVTQNIRNLGGRAKVVTVETKLQNISSQNVKVEFYTFVLQNKVWSNGINPELFFELNPENVNMNTLLEANSEIFVKLPYVIYDFQVKEKQWEELEATQFDLVLSVYPDRKVIHMTN